MYARTEYLTRVINLTWHNGFKRNRRDGAMWIEILYMVAMIVLGAVSGVIGMVLWLLYWDDVCILVDRLGDLYNKTIYKFIDMILGKHEEY